MNPTGKPPRTNRDRNSSETASIRDASCYATMMGAGESYLSAFGIFLHASVFQIGVLAALPPFLGSLFQAVSVWLSNRFSNRRSLIVVSSAFQGLLWIPIGLLAFSHSDNGEAVLALIFLVTLYHCASGFITPLWSSLIGDLIPEKRRGEFFGERNGWAGLFTCLSFLFAGALLEASTSLKLTAVGYASIFTVALFGRLGSSYWLLQHDNPAYKPPKDSYFTFLQFLKRFPRSSFPRFVIYVSLMAFAVSLSGPYFTVYLLRDLHLTYLQYTIIVCAAATAQFLSMQTWGKFADHYGSKRILTVCGYGISIFPLLWVISGSLWYLTVLQIFGAMMWAGFSMGTTTFLFDAVTPAKRARCTAYFSIIHASCVLIGSLIGCLLHSTLPSLGHPRGVYSSLPTLFLVSGGLRFAVAFFFSRYLREVREVRKSVSQSLIFRIVHLRPIGGATFGSVSSWMRNARPSIRVRRRRKRPESVQTSPSPTSSRVMRPPS